MDLIVYIAMHMPSSNAILQICLPSLHGVFIIQTSWHQTLAMCCTNYVSDCTVSTLHSTSLSFVAHHITCYFHSVVNVMCVVTAYCAQCKVLLLPIHRTATLFCCWLHLVAVLSW